MNLQEQIEQLKTSLLQAENIQMELDRRVYYLKTLYDVSRDIFGSVDYKTILKNFLMMTMGNFGVAEGFILTVDVPSEEINGFISVGFQSDDILLLRTGGSKILLSADIAKSLQSEADLKSHGLLPPEMICAIMFDVNTDCKGLLGLGSKLIGEPYNADDQELMNTLVNNLVVALKNARSFEEIKSLNRNLQKMMAEVKQSEAALRESEERHRLSLEASPDPIVVYDIQGKVSYVNHAFEQTFGWLRDEVIGNRIDFVPQENLPETKVAIERMLQDEKTVSFETRRLTKDGRLLDIQISASRFIDGKDKVAGNIVILSDITEHKREEEEKRKLEVQLQRAEKMEAIGTLAGGVAHDLNNMLSAIVGYPELLLMQIPEDSPLRKSILRLQDSGNKAAAIVQDLLTLARRGVGIKEVVNIKYIILEYLKSPEHEKLKLYHPWVEIETNVESDLLNISGSSVHLFKTVENLVSNAAEAMPDGGKIFISAENRYIDKPINGYDSVEEGEYITLMVSDTGIGISKKDLERIFEPFYTKKVMGRSGTGLGTAVVWGTVKDHKGYIDVQSTEGKGSTFTLYFPASREKMTKKEGILPVEDYMGKGESILVVDDVKEQIELALTMLTTLGYSAHAVSSGEEAVEYLKEHIVDLIVLDMVMDPGMDGLDTYKKIIKLHPQQKAIIASGFSETDRVKEAQRLGAGAYVKKPYTLEKIGLSVRDELKKITNLRFSPETINLN
jgi:two-component system, cell cycle sensor histidine kinase and response regulator CckA